VQAKHYDKYSYLPEKTEALAKWEAHLEAIFNGSSTTIIHGAFRPHQIQAAVGGNVERNA
jgi:hypothetical protein